ncbi:APC family permease [Clostridium perfringens]|uniref:APC family permease n=1 Tax=Clostridium perfringens TaxID=1502 RepID=UPI003AF8599E
MKEIKLNRIDIFSIVLGAIIGWGSFMLPGTKFLKESGVINTFLGLFLGVICIIIIEKNYLIMMQTHDEEGGEFSFTYNNLGKKHGFIVGWFLTLAYFTMIPLNATAFPLVIKKIFGGILEFGYLYNVAGYNIYLGEILTSSIIIIAFAALNLNGIKKTSKVQNLIIFSLISMTFIVLVGMIIKGNRIDFINTYINKYSFDLSQIIKVFAITPFAFIGFDAIPQLSKELNFSKKKASRVAVISLVMGALIYNILNVITALAYSPEQASSLEWAAGSAVLRTLGKGAFFLLIIALTAAVWSGINGFMICSSKLLGSIANYKMLPSKMGKINKNGVFSNAIIFITIVSLIAPWFGRQAIIWIVDMSSLGVSVAYFYVSFIVLKESRNTKDKILSGIGVIISIIFMLLLILPISPAALSKESLIALIAWCIIGFIAYNKIQKDNIEV